MMAVCRLCCADVRQINSVLLFSPPSLKIDLLARLSRLVEVSVEEGDGLCLYIFRVGSFMQEYHLFEAGESIRYISLERVNNSMQ